MFDPQTCNTSMLQNAIQACYKNHTYHGMPIKKTHVWQKHTYGNKQIAYLYWIHSTRYDDTLG